MALTFTPDFENAIEIAPGWYQFTGQISLDSSYVTDGYELPENFQFEDKFGTFKGVIFEDHSGYRLYYNTATSKIMVYVSGGTEVTNGVDLSDLTSIFVKVEGTR